MTFAKCFQSVCLLLACVSMGHVLYALVFNNIETISMVAVFCTNILNLMVANHLIQNERHKEIMSVLKMEEKE